jgi:hypothetical protein
LCYTSAYVIYEWYLIFRNLSSSGWTAVNIVLLINAPKESPKNRGESSQYPFPMAFLFLQLKNILDPAMVFFPLGFQFVFIRRAFCVKFIYSEKATKFCKMSTLDLTLCTAVKFKMEIFQNFVAFSEYMNFNLPVERKEFCISVIVFLYFNKKLHMGEKITKMHPWPSCSYN